MNSINYIDFKKSLVLLFNGDKPIVAVKLHLVNPDKSIVFNLAVPSSLDF